MAACGPGGRAPQPAERLPPAAPAPPAGVHYRIDPARSQVRILVYRAGPLARLGHSHVLLAHELAGEAWVPADPAGARFALSFPVAALEVDPAAARREEGEEFASELKAADVEGTRRNLLGPAVLDAPRYPTIRLEGEAGRSAGGLSVRLRATVRDRTVALEVPVALTSAPGELVAQGGFTLLQSALGLTPFSIGLGALTIRDDLAVRFRLVALADPAPPGAAQKN